MTAVVSRPTPTREQTQAGSLLIALSSAAAFGLSGSLGRSLLDLGWAPTTIVALRIGGACAVLLIPCLIILRRTGLPTRRQSTRLLVYGVVAVAGAQLCYFSAVQYLSVAVALLLEYLAPVLLIGYHWARTRQRPRAAVLLGAVLAVFGLALVLDLPSGLTINLAGVAWGLGAAVCLCGYFILSEDDRPDTAVHPLVLTTAGTGVGAVALACLGAVGVLPWGAHAGTTTLAGVQVGWAVPLLGLILFAAAFAYLTGIIAVRRLGSSAASFVALTEVIFAVLFAFLLLAQRPGLIQLGGGALVLAGIVVVQRRSGAVPGP